MLIKKDYVDGDNSIYQCDRCKQEFKNENIYGLFIKSNKIPNSSVKKKFDLCRHCKNVFVRSTETYYERKMNKE